MREYVAAYGSTAGFRRWQRERLGIVAPARGNRSARRSAGQRGPVAGSTFDPRPFGVELEFFGIDRATAVDVVRRAGVPVVDAYRSSGSAQVYGQDGTLVAVDVTTGSVNGAWQQKSDGSVSGTGLELVSPPLAGADGFDALRRVMDALRAAGARVDRTCGMHVHLDGSGLAGGRYTAAGIGRLAQGYWSNAQHMDALVAPSRRPGGSSYTRQPRPEHHDAAQALVDAGTVRLGSVRSPWVDRYCTVNLAAIAAHGTVEFRQHQGTLDYRKAAAWVRLLLALAAAAERGPVPAYGTLGDMLAALVPEDATYLAARAAEHERRAQAAERGRHTRAVNAAARRAQAERDTARRYLRGAWDRGEEPGAWVLNVAARAGLDVHGERAAWSNGLGAYATR